MLLVTFSDIEFKLLETGISFLSAPTDMEIAGLTLSVAGIVSLVEGCSKLYDRVSSAKSWSEDSQLLSTLLQVEKGRFSALRLEIQGIVDPSGENFSMTNNRQVIEKTTKTVSDISIKGDGRVILIENILQHLNRILGEAESLISKYDPESNSASQSSSRSRDKFMGYMSKKTRPTKWAVGDKASLEDLVQKLHKLNDGLEEQLPRLLLPRLRLGFATSQILPAGTEQLRSIQDAALHAGYGILSKGAAVRLACLSQEVVSLPLAQIFAEEKLMNFTRIGIDKNNE